ncbi:restriction endonuclease subunit S [Vibrio gigantis]|uniref:Restriction endonuclease subunit S n=1 Tax=Vibrio gigantis TaxID=296199 RepID=A0A5M9NBY9_9VIBR|nr:restriction endonuclease subunit S [Vibrio gigantis]KAA8667537.1 restriction endonuclease subunit S [Vibrio gigantis]
MSVEKNVPEIRFNGFSGEWANKNIGDIFQVTSGATPLRSDARYFENADMSWVKTTDLNNGVILKTEEKISQIALVETSVKILPKGTVFVAMYGGFNQIGRTGLLEKEATCNQALSAIYPNDKVVPYYLLTYLNLNVDAWKDLAASSRKDPNITKSDVLDFPFLYPSIKEQTAIGNTFQKLDSLINQHQQKHDKLSNIKKAMLEKMFPKQGETLPEIRFKGFSGEWEEKVLEDICDVRDGTHASPKYQQNGFPLVTSKNVKNGYINYDDVQYISKIDFDEINKRSKVDVNDILIGMIGTIGNIALIRQTPDFAIKNVALIKDKNEMDFLYSYYFLQSPITTQQLDDFASGGTQKFISLSNVRSLLICVPEREEQTAIGNYFQKLDTLINQHQQQINKLNNIKQACLSKMFV